MLLLPCLRSFLSFSFVPEVLVVVSAYFSVGIVSHRLCSTEEVTRGGKNSGDHPRDRCDPPHFSDGCYMKE